jgi:hypothetical protein
LLKHTNTKNVQFVIETSIRAKNWTDMKNKHSKVLIIQLPELYLSDNQMIQVFGCPVFVSFLKLSGNFLLSEKVDAKLKIGVGCWQSWCSMYCPPYSKRVFFNLLVGIDVPTQEILKFYIKNFFLAHRKWQVIDKTWF